MNQLTGASSIVNYLAVYLDHNLKYKTEVKFGLCRMALSMKTF